MTKVKIALALTECALALVNHIVIMKNEGKETNHTKIKEKETKIKRKRARKLWMASIFQSRTRETMNKQLSALLEEPYGQFRKFISVADFECLVHKITPYIERKDTNFRTSIPARLRFAVTLHYLLTGDSYSSLQLIYKISKQSLSRIIPDVCNALNDVLKDEVQMPSAPHDWLQIENKFKHKFPHAVGILGGKHVSIHKSNIGTDYVNYKKIVLFALVDADYNFMHVEIASDGCFSDGSIFKNTYLFKALSNNDINFPPPEPLPGGAILVPYFFLADDPFILSSHVMKPFAIVNQTDTFMRIFNDRLSSCQLIVENTLGILASRFGIFQKELPLNLHSSAVIIQTCVVLHNFLRKSETSSHMYIPCGTIDVLDENGALERKGTWRQNISSTCALADLKRVKTRPLAKGICIREELVRYFSS